MRPMTNRFHTDRRTMPQTGKRPIVGPRTVPGAAIRSSWQRSARRQDGPRDPFWWANRGNWVVTTDVTCFWLRCCKRKL